MEELSQERASIENDVENNFETKWEKNEPKKD